MKPRGKVKCSQAPTDQMEVGAHERWVVLVAHTQEPRVGFRDPKDCPPITLYISAKHAEEFAAAINGAAAVARHNKKAK